MVVAADERQTHADGLWEARALIGRGDVIGGLAVLERVRGRAVADGDGPVLEDVFDLACRVYLRTDGEARRTSGALVLASAEALSTRSQKTGR